MKSALHWILAAALLLQGALAVAMPISMAQAPTASSMPCHAAAHRGDPRAKSRMACCAHDHCACQAICSAIALPVAVASVRVALPTLTARALPQPLARAGFRLTPLRPPIDL